MKARRYIAALAAIAAYAAVAADGGTTTVKSWDGSRDLGFEIKNGKLIYQAADLLGGRRGSYQYQPKGKPWIALSSSLGALNILFTEEIKDRASAIDFLNGRMPYALIAIIAGENRIVDASLLETFKGGQKRKLGQYLSDIKPAVESNEWTLMLRVVTPAGGIEKWTFFGEVNPLQIKSLSREMLERDGVFIMGPEIGRKP